MLPPSDSDEDDEDEAPAPKKGGQPSTAGMLPPSDSDSDEDSEEEPPPKPKKELQPAVADAPKPKKEEEEVDPEQARKDLERLELIRQRREDSRLQRIKDEGWDRFAPESDTNRRPDGVPKDHPSRAGLAE
ncbi:hypothetical protein COCSUDRAFT_60146 [Coccomyxa subellipsoidea C-169]|uniref:Casein kinase substrate phosphoprotein PP28 domain-containing protein n=1 Tax=Coccomyxa subellipsoidea (strain C-169) TaxID=574566 RepID=I0YJB1_COCSC|nr:hypothetical protein COCSUDRAFT_60146 [Coccomyxa subellipsoidea C-169]EIE18480.1 hypothetical protein COCSUDRAFT_60146 [Coccomyxa subellipsoidea C-169]|eukprot:XP_005643024.1 hypothetical protein COCSUDRAFT_60146 [Coccomyxa subellipsoidea C-169]